MKTHDDVIKTLMRRPSVKAEVERIERQEGELLDALLIARHEVGLTHGLTRADLAVRMGTQAPAAARLERSLATGKHSPSVATMRKYAAACGKHLRLQLCG